MTRRNEFLKEIGVGAIWTLRNRPVGHPDSERESEIPGVVMMDDVPQYDDIPPCFFESSDVDETTASARPDVSGMDWEQLEESIRHCKTCGLCQGRTQAVPGVGDRNADWLFVGEGPGFYEDQQGEPFVGASGKLLDNMLLAIGLKRGNKAYIANVVKCRATDSSDKDRPPTPDEAAACRPFLDRQIALIQPKMIVAIGRIAATTLLGTDPQTPLGVLRGKVHMYRMSDGSVIPLVATYHPAYLLRQLSEKRKAWEDLCLAMRTLQAEI
jgi:uracil-DNA glycosylase